MSGHSRVLGRVEVAEADPARDAALDWLQAEREVARAIQDPVDLNGTFCARCHYPVAKWLHRCSVCREPVGR